MNLKMKTFGDILSNMANWIKSNSNKLTNFFVGSVIRTLLEAVAVEMESMYFQMYKGFKYAIENAIFHSFNFYRNPATASTGYLTVVFKGELPQDFTFSAGFKFSTVPLLGDIVYFAVTEDIVVPKGATDALIPVQCTETGVVGNVPPNSIQIPVTPVGIIQSVYNETAFGGGTEQESTADRKRRFTTYIQTLSRGTINAIRYGCISVPGVSGAYVEDGVGLVKVYVHNSAGDLPDSLKAAVVLNLVEYCSAGVQVEVLPVIKIPVDAVITILLQEGFDPDVYEALVETSVTSFLNYFPVSKSLATSELIKTIMTIDENAILNCSTSLTSDVIVDKSGLIRAGVVQVIVQEVS